MRITVSDPLHECVKVWATREVGPERVPSLARKELAKWLGAGHPALPDLQEIASELITNAILHADAEWVRLSLSREPYAWQLTVTDPGAAGKAAPPSRQSRSSDERGRGLLIVDALTEGRWDTTVNAAGERVVWTQLRR
jgi:anti-sigma regulatory factor (Ser/Thr protein kinase)